MATFWDMFDSLLDEAEAAFLAGKFDEALEKWHSYYRITAKVEYGSIIKEIENLVKELKPTSISTLNDLYAQFKRLRLRFLEKQIHRYTYDIFSKLFTQTYRQRFASGDHSLNPLIHGIFNYLNGHYAQALHLLENFLKQEQENVEARIFLGHAYLAIEEQKKAVGLLTQNLFLAADQLYEEDLYLNQFRMLFGRLHTKVGRRNVAAWLLVFEAWFRSYLVFEPDEQFFKLMLKKEQNERIIRVKYTAAERYRHFSRCLFIADYARLYDKKSRGLITEMELFMEQLDPNLFVRYRRKRKPLKETV